MRASSMAAGRALNVLVKAAFANALPDDLLTDTISLDRAKELFTRYVDQVEIENHSFCNRVCWFCPNAFIDRRTVSHEMPAHVFETIVGGLSEIDYAGVLTWSRYHEALADPRIFDRVQAARSVLPRAGLVIISNGDYLNRDTLPRLDDLGLDRLMIDLYMPDGRERDPKAIGSGLRKFSRRTGMLLERTGEFSYRVTGLRMKATVDIPFYTESNISTRGGLVEVKKLSSYRRRAVCMAPIRHVVIDYNGKGMMCCQTRSDSPAHRQAIVGDLAEPGYGVFHLYRDLGMVRRALLSPGEKSGVCLTCDVRDDGPDRMARREWAAGVLRRVPGVAGAVDGLWRRVMRRDLAV